jgi:hypothetical protein
VALLQLNPQIPMETPIGAGLAFLVCDYSEEQHALWVVADTATGQIWWWPNNLVRMQKNISLGRDAPETPARKD